MSFDARSLERLQQLGRTLPQPLPRPAASSKDSEQAAAKASQRRHRVETEQDPQALFRELMQISPDGNVPAHLLDRLKQLENLQQNLLQDSAPQAGPSGLQSQAGDQGNQQRLGGRRAARGVTKAGLGHPDRRTALEHTDLYTAFQQLLLEDEAD